MNTYYLTWMTNHGEYACVINASSREKVDEIARDNEYIWDDYTVELVDTTTEGVVAGIDKELGA